MFAGVASLELNRQEEAKGHYRTAITLRPEEQLAWKVYNIQFNLFIRVR